MKINDLSSFVKNNNLISRGDHIVLGLSGGPDSVCLFFVLKELGKELGLSIYPAHINHNLRGDDSYNDQDFSEKLSKDWGFPCKSIEVDCNRLAKAEGLSTEEAGRKIRYDAFDKLAQEIYSRGIPREKISIALAHNLDDQGETVLFRIIRGTGVDGLAGMKHKTLNSSGFKVIRPLLDYSKSEIMDFLIANSIDFAIDKTNEEKIYTRNKLRLDLIPKIRAEYNENIIDSLVSLSKIASEDSDYLKKVAEVEYSKCLLKDHVEKGLIVLDSKKLISLDKPISKRIIQMAIGNIATLKDVSREHLENVLEILKTNDESKQCHLPNNIKVTKTYDNLSIESLSDSPLYNYQLRWYDYNGEDGFTNYEIADNRVIKRILVHADAFKNILSKGMKFQLRYRKAGDRISIGAESSKLIKKLFIDDKIPIYLRDKIQMVTVGSEVVWIPGVPWSESIGRVAHEYSLKNTQVSKDGSLIVIEVSCVL